MTSPGDEHRRPAEGAPAYPTEPDQTHPYGGPPEGSPYAPPPGGAPYGNAPYGNAPYGNAPYGGTPHGNAPQGGAPYGASGEPPYVYNPYGSVSYPTSYPSSPAGLGPDDRVPVRRPGSVTLAFLLMVLATLPYLFFGLVALLAAPSAAQAVPPEELAQLQELGVNLEQVVRVTGVVLLVVALLYLLLAFLAWRGRGWARGLAAALTAGFALMVLVSIAAAVSQGAALDAASLLLILAPAALAVTGVVLLFGSAAREWFGRSRR